MSPLPSLVIKIVFECTFKWTRIASRLLVELRLRPVAFRIILGVEQCDCKPAIITVTRFINALNKLDFPTVRIIRIGDFIDYGSITLFRNSAG